MIPEVTGVSIFLYFVFVFFAAIVIRYFIAAGLFYWYFYRFRYSLWKLKKINKDTKPDRQQFLSEVKWSIITSAIFAAIGALTIILYQHDYTMIYTDMALYGYWYLPVSLVGAMLVHETYYYWIHRWMHKPNIFRVVHKVHHNSIVTSPWTAFSFHPLEGLLEALIIPIILMIIPVHIYVLGFYLILMTISSIINHLDIEIYPDNFLNNRIGKWFIGATHHHYHHKEFKTNYGLYFTFWDKWMKTESDNFTSHNR